MGIVIARTDRINFTNGQFIEVPILTEFTAHAGEVINIPQKCALFAAVRTCINYVNSVEFYGLPFGETDDIAWIDMDGNKWWIENTGLITIGSVPYQSYIYHFGPLGNSSSQIISERSEDGYHHEVVAHWVYGFNNIIRVRQLALSSVGHESFQGLNGYIYSNDPTTQFTWANYPDLNLNYAYNYLGDTWHWNPYYRDFGYVRYHIRNELGNQLSYYNHSVAESSLPNSIEKDVDVEEYDDDPNKRGGNSTPGGGGGSFDNTSDPIPVPGPPTLNATDAGFVTLFKPTLGEMRDLARRLFSPNILELVSNKIADPMDLVIGLGIVPVSAPASTTKSPSVGPIIIPLALSVYDSQYYSFDCGSISIEEYWGSALDYSPYTRIDIYLPYIGLRALSVDEIMGHSLGIQYNVDLFGGGILAFVTVDGSVRYQFSGNCLQQIPVSQVSYDQLINNLVSLACVVGSGVAAAGAAGAAAAVGEEAAAIGAGGSSTSSAISKGVFGSEYADVRGLGFKEWSDGGGGKALANCTMNAVMGSKPTVERTGAVSATTGQLAVQTPFIIITRPRQSLPDNYKHYGGYPSNMTAKLNTLNGFTKVDSIRINNLAATEPELVEIYSLLKKGVII